MPGTILSKLPERTKGTMLLLSLLEYLHLSLVRYSRFAALIKLINAAIL
jgi:hypothetical protein